MATTFTWIFLGNSSTALDPTEGNSTAENANAFVGQTYGAAGSPLFARISSVTAVDTGGTAGVLDQNNTQANDTFSTNIGAGTSSYTFDGTAIYNATLTYADGSTGTVTAVIAQDTAGNLFLVPDAAAGSDTAAYEAKPIVSLKLNSVSGNADIGLATDRYVTGFDDGYIDGTATGDLIDSKYVEPVAGGTDKIDNKDAGLAGSSGDDDHVRAGGGNDSIYADKGNDAVYGGDGNDLAYGGDANDSVLGEAGDDTLSGDAGDDRVFGGLGNDQVYGGADNDTLSGDDGNDTLTGDNGNDQIFGGVGNDQAYGGNNDDQISGDDGNDTLYGDSKADSLFGGLGSDQLYGGSENDLLTGGAGADVLDGGTGTDAADYSASGSAVTVNLATGLGAGGDAAGDTLSGIEMVTGSALDDNLTGSSGANTLDGGVGNDTLAGGAAADSLIGGTGTDTVAYSASASGVTVNLLTGLGSGGDAAGDTLVGVENVTGSGNADSLTGDGGANRLDGGVGNDTLAGGYGSDSIVAGAGDDRVTDEVFGGVTGGGADTVDLGDGADVFAGSGQGPADTDLVYGGLGNDTITVRQSFDTVYGGDGDDTLSTLDESAPYGDQLYGDAGNDAITGANTNDQLYGGSGNDLLYGAANTDTLEGGIGDDTLSGGAGADSLIGGAGTDTADYAASGLGVAVDLGTGLGLGGDAAGDTLAGVENIAGSAYADTLRGDGAGNALFGGAANDQLAGGQGNDSLTGGVGNDRYVFETNGGRDTIRDFDLSDPDRDGQTSDQLDVSALRTAEGGPVKAFDVAIGNDGQGNAVLQFPGGEQVTIVGLSPAAAAGPGVLHSMGIPCFASGTRILTVRGMQAIEEIAVGDRVVTAGGGSAPVLWHGRRHLTAQDLNDQPQLRPIRLLAGRFGNVRDLTLSPQHAVWVAGSLIRARHLAEWGRGARVARGVAQVSYHHLLLPQHALIRAEGAWVESFYPGRMALAALRPMDRLILERVILAGRAGGAGTLCRAYGPRFQPVLTQREAQAWLRRGLVGHAV